MAFAAEQLVQEFALKLSELCGACHASGVEMRPYFGLRTPLEQAALWRQSRCREEIDVAVARLRRDGAPYLAHCLEAAGPHNGPPVTNALPGLSWHQWGEAADCVWVVNGASEWSTVKKINGSNGYALFAEQAQAKGLEAGGLWKKLKDWPHVQLRHESSPLKVYGLADIDRIMHERFGTR